MTARRIAALLNPSSVVVVGASGTPGTLGDIARRNLRDAGFQGAVHLVNPRHAAIEGVPALPSVRDLPGPVDLALLLTPASVTARVLADCAEKGVRGAVVTAADARHAGRPDRAFESELRDVARRTGIRFLGPNSLGVLRTDTRLNAACGPSLPQPGRLALVSESSALCAATLDWARERHVGFSTVIASGSGSDILSGEILDFLARDAATDGIMLYLEAVDEARRFMSALRAAARVKPVVVLKPGDAHGLPDSRAFHSGALVGSDDVFDAAMRRAGVLRINDLTQLYGAASTLASRARVRGRRLAIVTNSAGPGQLAADRAVRRGLELARDASPGATGQAPAGTATTHVHNDAPSEQYAAAIRARLESPDVDALLAMLSPFPLADPDGCADALVTAASAQNKPVFTCWLGGAAVAASRRRFADAGIPTFTTPEAAVDAIAALAQYATNQEQLLQVPAQLAASDRPDKARAQALIDAALAADRRWLGPAESKELLAAFGVPVVRGIVVHSPEEAVRAADEVGYPVALKILSPEIAHKTDAGGVRLGRADARSVHDGYVNMRRDVALARPDARIEGVLVEPMVPERHARELMVGVVRDAVFGPAILFGLGGTMVEVIRDRAVALPPLNAFLARDLVWRTRANLALQPLRGAPAAARVAVEDILLRVSGLVCELPDVGPIDLNPVVVSESGALVIDARIGVRRSPPDARPYTHMAIHPYPTDLEWPLELPGGELATIRPIRPEDAGIEQDFVARLSEQSRFLRFMFGLHALTPTMLARFTQIDYDRELALVVVRALPDGGEQQVGVARYITLADEETCEFAIVVSDEWQGKGVARRLFARLIDAARERRLRVMTGVTLRENSKMLDLAHSFGFETHADAEEPELLRMTLAL